MSDTPRFEVPQRQVFADRVPSGLRVLPVDAIPGVDVSNLVALDNDTSLTFMLRTGGGFMPVIRDGVQPNDVLIVPDDDEGGFKVYVVVGELH